MARVNDVKEAKYLCAVARGNLVVAMNALEAGLLNFAAASAREGAIAAREAAEACARLGDVGTGLKELQADTSAHAFRPAESFLSATSDGA